MDSFEWNKIFGAVLGSVLAIMVLREVGSLLYHDEPLDVPGYAVALPEKADAVGDVVVEEPEEMSIALLMQEAKVSSGQRVAARCVTCHYFEKGAGNKIGPNLYGVLGRDIAAVDGFRYSSALQGLGGAWTYERLDAYLENPAGWAPGTIMGFAGLNKETDRANVIAYIRAQADELVPLPIVEAAAEAETTDAETDGAAADGAAADDAAETVSEEAGEGDGEAASEEAEAEEPGEEI